MKKMIVTFICFLLVIPCSAETITVDDDGPADFNNIQDAVFYAWDGDIVVVLEGVYQENILFTGCAITVTSMDPNDPDVVEATIITCDSGNAVTIDFGEGDDTVLQGFTIIAGVHAIYCSGTSPTIKKNVIRDCGDAGICGNNAAAPVICNNKILNNLGGGIVHCDGPISHNVISYNENSDSGGGLDSCGGAISGNIISANVVTGSYGYGGGLYGCSGNIIGNFISGNIATALAYCGYGGGIADCNGRIQSNIISGNTAMGQNVSVRSRGGGLYECHGAIIGNTIVGNRVIFREEQEELEESGGGIYSSVAVDAKNNIIAHNRAKEGGGIYGDCNNTYNFYYMNLGGDLGGGAIPGIGERRLNPVFAVAGYWDDPCGTPDALNDDVWVDGDYHLKSEADRWDPNSQTWVFDDITSRCIDAGDPTSDWTAELWPHSKRINIGAYGGTREASMSLSDVGNVADLNNDGIVNMRDFAVFADAWQTEVVLLPEDLNRDNHIDIIDGSIFVDNWLWEE